MLCCPDKLQRQRTFKTSIGKTMDGNFGLNRFILQSIWQKHISTWEKQHVPFTSGIPAVQRICFYKNGYRPSWTRRKSTLRANRLLVESHGPDDAISVIHKQLGNWLPFIEFEIQTLPIMITCDYYAHVQNDTILHPPHYSIVSLGISSRSKSQCCEILSAAHSKPCRILFLSPHITVMDELLPLI